MTDEKKTTPLTVTDIREIINDNFSQCLKSLSDISSPDPQEDKLEPRPLIHHQGRFHDYDEIVKQLFKQHPSSPDMVLFGDDILVFVEFKSGKIKKKDVKLKAIEGCFIVLHELVQKHKGDIPFSRIMDIKKHFILVHKADRRNSAKRVPHHIHATASHADLEMYEGRFFHKINIWREEKFLRWMQDGGWI